MTIEVKQFNPVSRLKSDQEIIDFLVDCYIDDDTEDERVFQRAMEFVIEAKGIKSVYYIHKAYKHLATKIEHSSDNVHHKHKTLSVPA